MNRKVQTQQILMALDNAKKALPSEALLQKMESVAVSYSQLSAPLTMKTIVGIAASVMLLLAVNIYAISDSQQQNTETMQTEITSSTYLLPTKYFYNE